MKTLLLTVSSFTSISFCFIVFVFFLFLLSKLFWNNYSSVPNCRGSQITHFVKKPSSSFKILVIFYRPTPPPPPFVPPAFPLLRLPPTIRHRRVDALWNHWLLLQHIFGWNAIEKRNLKNSFWSPNLVYQSPIQPE